MALRINFCDFWPTFPQETNFFLSFLEKYFDVTLHENPDYLFYSVYGNNHLKYNDCIKILYTGENIVPDFNLCDYAIGFHHLDFDDRYMRFPLYVYYQWEYKEYLKNRPYLFENTDNNNAFLHKRKFCNFIFSNNVNSDPMRDLFFHELCKYKKVDSGGRHLNNIGHPVVDKMEFIKDYKFTIAFENSSVPGYTTEKLIEPIIMNSLPIYYGNPLVHYDFNIDSMIYLNGAGDIQRAIEEIIFLDKNDKAYLEILNRPKAKNDNNPGIWEEKLLVFMKNIFSQELSHARRKPEYGFTKYYFEELKLQSDLLAKRKKRNKFRSRLRSLIKI
jgi:alpha(1,3/1,4) fucosyltransferase